MNLFTSIKQYHFVAKNSGIYNKLFDAQILKAMKFTFILITVALLQVSAKSPAQNVTLNLKDVSLEKVFRDIEKQTGFGFLYTKNMLQDAPKVNINLKNVSLEDALVICFKNLPLTFSIIEKTIVLKTTEKKTEEAKIPKLTPPVLDIKGRVVNENGEPMEGVSVVVKGTKEGTMTNKNGEFGLQLSSPKAILVFSSVGYEEWEVEVNHAKAVPLIKLIPLIKSGEDLIIVGYGKVERKKLIGSVGTYKPNELGAKPLTVDQMLVGRIAGVQVSPSSGVLGSATAITIRGVSTISNAGNAPLIVIDGVPMYGIDNTNNTTGSFKPSLGFAFSSPGSITQGGYTPPASFEQDPLATLNPDDIESIEVLKDAYANAIYGSRAAAGVILITTKKGSVGKPTVNIQFSNNIQQAFGRPSIMTGDQYVKFYNSLLDTLRRNPPTSSWPGTLANFQTGNNTNWLDQVLRNGKGVDLNASVSGGNDRTRYYLSGGYDKQESFIINNDFERAQARMNIENKFTDRFKIGTSIGLSYTNNNALNAQKIYTDAVLKAPNVPIKDSLGNYIWKAAGYTFNGITYPATNSYASTADVNPVGTAMTSTNYINEVRTTGNMFAEYRIADWINLRSEFGIDWLNGRAYSRDIAKPTASTGGAFETNNANRKYVLNNLININKTFNQHQFAVVLGQSFEKSVESTTSTQGIGFLNDQILSIGSATTRTVVGDLQQSWALFSVFGRLDYTFKNKYLLGVTDRVDGSSRFSANNRYLSFPSFSAGWIISNENFIKQVRFVNELKIRTSIGFTGTDGGSGYYGTQGVYALNGTNTWGNTSALQVSSPSNPNLKWQHTRTIDAGLDAKLFNSRLNINVDYYNKHTSNMLALAPLPGFIGFTSQLQNLGEMRNAGFEITLETRNIVKKDFQWTSSFNIARNTNIITRLYLTDSIKNALNNAQPGGRIWLQGQSATAFTLFKWGGVDPANGNPIWVGNDKTTSEVPWDIFYTGVVNSSIEVARQRANSGDALPKFFGGFSNRLRYKNLSLDFFFSFASGNKVFNGAKAALYNYTSADAPNLSPDMLNYWKQPGEITNIPGLMNSSSIAKFSPTATQSFDYTVQRTSDRFLEDGSFIRLRNLTLAYNFPVGTLNRLGIAKSRISVYVQADNVFIITKYSGIDPEVSAYGSSALSAGFDELTLPNPRTYRFGFKFGL